MNASTSSLVDINILFDNMLEIIKEGNRLLRIQSLERFEKLQDLIIESKNVSNEIIQLTLEEIKNLHSDSNTLLAQLKCLYTTNPLNNEILESLLGQTEIEADNFIEDNITFQLAEEILQQDANLMARDELIGIMQEDIVLNKAARFRLIGEIATLQNEYKKVKQQVNVLEKILLYNNRFRVVEIISKHPEGITIENMTATLGKRNDEILPILEDLKKNSYIEKRGNLIKPIIM